MKKPLVVPSVVVVAIVILALVARAQDGDLPTGFDESGGQNCAWLATIFFPTIPVLAGLLGAVVTFSLHWVKSATVARAWQGRPLGRSAFWVVPVVAGVMTCLVLVGAALAIAWNSCADFANYVRSQAGAGTVGSILGGAAIALLPLVVNLVLPSPRPVVQEG